MRRNGWAPRVLIYSKKDQDCCRCRPGRLRGALQMRLLFGGIGISMPGGSVNRLQDRRLAVALPTALIGGKGFIRLFNPYKDFLSHE